MVAGEVVGHELRRYAAEGVRQPGAEHRHIGARAPDCAQQIRQQRAEAEADEHQHDHRLAGCFVGRAWRRAQRDADHAKHDCQRRQVLAATGVLAEHALAKEQQHQQAGGQRGLDEDQRSQQQREYLQRPTEDRQARSQQPPRAGDQPPDERQAQVLLVRGLLGVHRLQGYP